MRNALNSRMRLRGLSRVINSKTALPWTGSLAAYWDAEDITGVADGAVVTTWTDRIAAIVATQATGAAKPTLVKNQLGGLPCVRFGGSHWLSIATPGAMKTALDSKVWSVMIMARLRGTTTTGVLFGSVPAAPTDNIMFILDGTNAGRYGTALAPYTTTNEFITIGSCMQNNLPAGSASSLTYERMMLNGSPVQSNADTGFTGMVSSGTFAIGARANGAFPVNADIMAILVWNRTLTNLEYLQAEMWARDRWAQPYPWASKSKFYVFDGNSIMRGYGVGGLTNSIPYLCAQSLGLTYGQWSNIAISGMSMTWMDSFAPTRIDGLPAMIGKDVVLSAFEWYNAATVNPTHPAPYNGALSYLSNRKAASSRIKTVFGTSFDNARDSATPANRAAYNGAFDTYVAGAHPLVDGYAAFHNNANIGVNGAYGSFPANWADTIHLSAAGAAIAAPILTSAISSA